MKNLLKTGKKPNVAIFLSGSGTNAENLLKTLQDYNNSWTPKIIVTDNPNSSRAFDISSKFGLETVVLDIKEFYKARGETRVSLKSEKGRFIRDEWTNILRELIKPFDIDFGLLAGFVPLSNITTDFPCLNVHPGDLTVEKDSKRILVGLHTIPIEIAILNGYSSMRSSVIIAQNYTGKGGEMDTGPILGVSQQVPIDLEGFDLKILQKIYESRPNFRPKGGFNDILENIAKNNQETLKINGDWEVFPAAVAHFANNNYAMNDDNTLLFKNNEKWEKVKTIEFANNKDSKIIK